MSTRDRFRNLQQRFRPGRPDKMTAEELAAYDGTYRPARERNFYGGRRGPKPDLTEEEKKKKEWRNYSNIKDGLFVAGMLLAFISFGMAIIVSRSVVEIPSLGDVIFGADATSTPFQYFSILAYVIPAASIPIGLAFILLARKFMLDARDAAMEDDIAKCKEKTSSAKSLYYVTVTLNGVFWANVAVCFIWAWVEYAAAVDPYVSYFFLYNAIAFTGAFVGMSHVLAGNIYVLVVLKSVCGVDPNAPKYLTQEEFNRKRDMDMRRAAIPAPITTSNVSEYDV